MAIGRQDGTIRTVERAPRKGPQSFTVAMLLGDVLAWTRGERAAELSVIPKRSHTYFGDYKPGTAQRIPPVINTGPGSDYANGQRVRTALVARAAMFKAGLLRPQRRGDSGFGAGFAGGAGRSGQSGDPGAAQGGLAGTEGSPTIYHPEDQ